MAVRVSFEVDEDAITLLEELGIEPSDLARRLFDAEVKRRRAAWRHHQLSNQDIRLPRPAAGELRVDRDR